MPNRLYLFIRIWADAFADPWDINVEVTREWLAQNERPPRSRFWFGSPCALVRTCDAFVHVWLPESLAERYPHVAAALSVSSPRWGRSHRGW